jgi:hypothetical protein
MKRRRTLILVSNRLPASIEAGPDGAGGEAERGRTGDRIASGAEGVEGVLDRMTRQGFGEQDREAGGGDGSGTGM